MKASTWYSQLKKPTWAPPSWLFGPVWTFLYVLIIISFGKVFLMAWNHEIPVIIAIPFVLNIILNIAYTPLQFGLRNNFLAAIDVVLLLATLIWAAISIFAFTPWITYMQIPYLLWVSFATILQLTITFMNKKYSESWQTKILAITGSVLVWLPVLIPVFFSVIKFMDSRIFMFDYLIPAELFPAAVVGGGLLTWVAIRARSRQMIIIGWSFGAGTCFLIGGSALAVVSGLASGDIEPTGWQWALVLGSIVVYTLSLVIMGIVGILLTRDLYKPTKYPIH